MTNVKIHNSVKEAKISGILTLIMHLNILFSVLMILDSFVCLADAVMITVPPCAALHRDHQFLP